MKGYLDIETGTDGSSMALATQAEAEAGVETTKVMTPLRVAQAIAEREVLAAQAREYAVSDWWMAYNTGSGTANVHGFFGVVNTGTTPFSEAKRWCPQLTGLAWNSFADAGSSIDWDKRFIVSTTFVFTAHSTHGQFWFSFGRFAYGANDLVQTGFAIRVNDLLLTAQSYDSTLTVSGPLAVIIPGAHYHVALRNNADATATVYLNGTSVATLTGVPTGKQTSTFFSFNAANNADAVATVVEYGHVKFIPLD